VADLVLDYSRPGDILELEEIVEGAVSHTRVVAVKPVPRAVALYAADAMTTLRAAIEHTLYAEAQHLLGKTLTKDQARTLDMPAHVTPEAFDKWVQERPRRGAPPSVHRGTPLVARIQLLQPYQLRTSPEEHPLRLLAAHTNTAKHRSPAVTATRIGLVLPDDDRGVHVPPPTGEPVRPADVLATARRDVQTGLSIYPAVGIQRPNTGTWPVLLKELERLAEWTRKIAIPTLITGSSEVDPLPATFDISTGHLDERTAIEAGSYVSATDKTAKALAVALARDELPEVLATHPDRPPRELFVQWLAGLDDDDVLARFDRLKFAVTPAQMLANVAAVDEYIAEARAANGHESPNAQS